MEIECFDRLAKSLSTVDTRRGLLHLLPLAGGFGAFSLTIAAAKKRKAKKKCKKSCGPCKRCKKGKCKPKADGTVCGPDQVCSAGKCIVPACGAGGPCRVFLSSTLYTGNLGGLSGADAKCQGLAAVAGLPGTYKTWLSDNTSSPNSRFVPSTGPYRLINGTTIAANWADLTDGNLLAPIAVTETGGGVGDSTHAWTHTLINGAKDDNNLHCSDWSTNAAGSGIMGRATDSDEDWTTAGSASCGAFLHLYCFQQS